MSSREMEGEINKGLGGDLSRCENFHVGDFEIGISITILGKDPLIRNQG
jgi:hypothetical protein